MKTNVLYNKTNEELQQQLKELKSELFYLRFKHATNQLTKPQRPQQLQEGHRKGTNHFASTRTQYLCRARSPRKKIGQKG